MIQMGKLNYFVSKNYLTNNIVYPDWIIYPALAAGFFYLIC